MISNNYLTIGVGKNSVTVKIRCKVGSNVVPMMVYEKMNNIFNPFYILKTEELKSNEYFCYKEYYFKKRKSFD